MADTDIIHWGTDIEAVINSLVETITEKPVYQSGLIQQRGFKTREVPIALLTVPRPERCACLVFWKCEYRAIVKVGGGHFQFCEPCYLSYTRGVMEVFAAHIHDEED